MYQTDIGNFSVVSIAEIHRYIEAVIPGHRYREDRVIAGPA
jgi:hypothetical protein